MSRPRDLFQLPSSLPGNKTTAVFDLLAYPLTYSSSTSYYARKWLLFDFIYCFVLSQLRIPRLNLHESNRDSPDYLYLVRGWVDVWDFMTT